jgi:phage terminase large subunit
MSTTATTLQMPAWAECLFRRARYKIVRGGRGSGKSWAIARALILLASEKKLRVLCTREFQNSISESCHELLSSQIRAMGLGHRFTIQQQGIFGVNGSEFIFVGTGTSPEKIMSMEGIDIAWAEQAERISERSFEILLPTIRQPGSEVWCSFNPDEEDDPVWQRFVVNQPPDCISLEVNHDMNPWFPAELQRERDYLYRVDAESAAHVWGGQPRRNQSSQVLRGKYSVESFTVPDDPTVRRQQGWDGPYFGSDWGFANDPTTLVKCWIKGQVHGVTQGILYVEHEAYRIGCEITATPALFDTIPGSRDHMIRADCARPETISHVRNCGFRIEAADKWQGSVEDGIGVLRSFERIIVHERCVHAREEARLWSYRRDRLTGDVLPEVLDGNDHVWDGVRYALAPLIRKSRLAVYGDAADEVTFRDGDMAGYLFENRVPVLCGVEASTARVTVFLEAVDDGKTVWVTREFYYDSAQEGRQSDVLAHLFAFIRGSRTKSLPHILVREGTAGLTERIWGQGSYVSEQTEDDEAVVSGIRAVASALAQKKLRVHESCTNLLRELKLYRWDADKQARGIEQAEKKNSFSCDALRRVAVEVFGQQPWRLTLEEKRGSAWNSTSKNSAQRRERAR